MIQPSDWTDLFIRYSVTFIILPQSCRACKRKFDPRDQARVRVWGLFFGLRHRVSYPDRRFLADCCGCLGRHKAPTTQDRGDDEGAVLSACGRTAVAPLNRLGSSSANHRPFKLLAHMHTAPTQPMDAKRIAALAAVDASTRLKAALAIEPDSCVSDRIRWAFICVLSAPKRRAKLCTHTPRQGRWHTTATPRSLLRDSDLARE